MKVFLSWSGARSHGVAKVFSEWLPTVLTASKPWISSEDIVKGSTWITSIREALTESKGVGVFFATRDALASPWLNFEAGAIASLGAQRVCVVCVDIEPGEMNPPLSLFQSTKLEREDVFRLLKTLNGQLVEPASEAVLVTIFGRSWTELEDAIRNVLHEFDRVGEKASEKPSSDQVIADIATGVQRIESRLSALEAASQRLDATLVPFGNKNIRRRIVEIPDAKGRRSFKNQNPLEALVDESTQRMDDEERLNILKGFLLSSLTQPGAAPGELEPKLKSDEE